MRAGWQFDEVGPHFIRSYSARSCASVTGPWKALWVRAVRNSWSSASSGRMLVASVPALVTETILTPSPRRQTAKRSPGGGDYLGCGGAGEALHGARRHDGAGFGVGLVVLLDVLEVVEIVDHQAVRLAERAGGCVGQPVDLLEAGAV